MKRRWIAPGVLASLLVLSASFAPSAGAVVFRAYKGTTTQGKGIVFDLQHRKETGLTLSDFSFGARLECEDGSFLRTRVGFSFGDPGPSLPGGVLAFDDVFQSDILHVDGTFGPHKGSGTLSYTIPTLVSETEAQVCTTGEVEWTVARRATAAPAKAPSRPGVTVREVQGGHVTVWHSAT